MSILHSRPLKHIPVEISVPGDKSISHRSVMFAALCEGVTQIENFLPSEDCLASMKAMIALGADIEILETAVDGKGLRLSVTGHGMKLREPVAPIDCGNSGTTMRLLSGILAAQPFECRLFGDDSLSKRPMKRVADPLSLMGARIEGHGEKICAPLDIRGGKLHPITYPLPVASAQVKSAVLLAGLQAPGKTVIIEPAPTRDHTERLLAHFRVKTVRDGASVAIYGGQKPQPRDLTVPGDISSAAFWMVAAAAVPGAQITIRNVGLNPTRTGVINVLLRMGAKIQDFVQHHDGEPSGNIVVKGGDLNATVIGGVEIPNVIDELPVLAVAAALARGQTIIRDARELRVNETDRIAAVAHNLRLMGVPVDEFEDGMEITGGAPLMAAEMDSYGDHRIAMAFAIAGMFANGLTVIRNTECIATSYPGFENDLALFLNESSTPDVPVDVISRVPRKVAERLHPTEKIMPAPLVIAMDGPAASGKSSVAREVAKRLGWLFVNTGNMYRAATWAALRDKLNPQDEEQVARAAESWNITCPVSNGRCIILMDGHDIGENLNSGEVNRAVSLVARVPAVRDRLVAMQREIGRTQSVVMEGRDIGTVVFPGASAKFYIDATEEVRARRRGLQGQADAVRERDRIDSTRKTAPLVAAPDAVVIDSSSLTLEEVVARVMDELRTRGLIPPEA